jgi:hypothetical protein
MKFTPKILFLITSVVTFVIATELIWALFPYQGTNLMPPVEIEWTETEDEVSQPPA